MNTNETESQGVGAPFGQDSPIQQEADRLCSAWDDGVGRKLQLTGYARRVGSMYEAGCRHVSKGWVFSYLAPTPAAAFTGLTNIVTARRDREALTRHIVSRSPTP